MKRQILIIGATGNQGRSVIDALLKFPDAFTVRGLVRDLNSPAARRLTMQGVELVRGNLDDRKSLERAMQGVDGVFSYQSITDGVQKEEDRGKRVAHVAKLVGVEHLVYSSVGGADRNSDISYFRSKRRIETFIQELGLTNYTIFRPVAFMENFATRRRDWVLSFFRRALKGQPLQLIAVQDIGKWVAHALDLSDPYGFQEIEIAGDELTYSQIEDIYLKVEGRRPASKLMPDILLRRLGDIGKLYTWMSKDGYQADMLFCRSTMPDMLTFEQWLARDSHPVTTDSHVAVPAQLSSLPQ
jgi:uncharacterized protein YbjT (DUF2867 family)